MTRREHDAPGRAMTCRTLPVLSDCLVNCILGTRTAAPLGSWYSIAKGPPVASLWRVRCRLSFRPLEGRTPARESLCNRAGVEHAFDCRRHDNDCPAAQHERPRVLLP